MITFDILISYDLFLEIVWIKKLERFKICLLWRINFDYITWYFVRGFWIFGSWFFSLSYVDFGLLNASFWVYFLSWVDGLLIVGLECRNVERVPLFLDGM